MDYLVLGAKSRKACMPKGRHSWSCQPYASSAKSSTLSSPTSSEDIMESLSYSHTNELTVGSVPFHERHVFLCHKGPANWPENPFSFDWDCMPRRMRSEMKAREDETHRRAMFTVCEGRDAPGSYNGDILVFPDMLIYKSLTRFDVDCFVNEAVVEEQPRYLWPEPLTGCHIFVCCQATRDSLCGAIGPRVVARFREEIAARNLSDVHVWPCCHLSSDSTVDSCRGNVAIFKRSKPSCGSCGRTRSDDRRLSTGSRQQQHLAPEALAAVVAAASAGRCGEVRGDWYGHVTADDVSDLVELHVSGGDVVERLWRGRMGLWSQQQLQEQNERLTTLRCVSAGPDASSGAFCVCTADSLSRVASSSSSLAASRSSSEVGFVNSKRDDVSLSPSSTLLHLDSCSTGTALSLSELPGDEAPGSSESDSPRITLPAAAAVPVSGSPALDAAPLPVNSIRRCISEGQCASAASPVEPHARAMSPVLRLSSYPGGSPPRPPLLSKEQQQVRQRRLQAHMDPWLLEEEHIKDKENERSWGKWCGESHGNWWFAAGSVVALTGVAAMAAMHLSRRPA